MERRFRINPAPFIISLFVGIMALTRFSQGVRAVNVVGLSGGGFSLGIGVIGLIASLIARRKDRA